MPVMVKLNTTNASTSVELTGMSDGLIVSLMTRSGNGDPDQSIWPNYAFSQVMLTPEAVLELHEYTSKWIEDYKAKSGNEEEVDEEIDALADIIYNLPAKKKRALVEALREA